MNYYKCSCGKVSLQAEWPPARCQGCWECGTSLELEGAIAFNNVEKHEYSTRYDKETEEPIVSCIVCGAAPTK